MDVLKKFKVHLRSLAPLIMHSDRLANPLHPLAKKLKEISCLKQKKDEHHLAMARIEFEGGLYYSDDIGIYMPSKCLMGCFKAAARKFKLGKQTKAITIDCVPGTPLLGYEKLDPEGLWSILNKKGEQTHVFSESVVVQQKRIMRTRPIFHNWEVEFEVYLNVELLSIQQFKTILETAGFEYGLCELRPEKATGVYGRFELVELTEI